MERRLGQIPEVKRKPVHNILVERVEVGCGYKALKLEKGLDVPGLKVS